MEYSSPNYMNSISYLHFAFVEQSSEKLTSGNYCLCSLLLSNGCVLPWEQHGWLPLWTRLIETLYGMELLSVISLGFSAAEADIHPTAK